MVPLGKTNMHELALGATSSSSFFGPVRNPWDPDRVSGGSSGGTAVSVALSKGPLLGLGSDTGGSIRVPAALCGVCGFKPSLGVLSTEGVFPLGATLDHSGLMTKTMPDLLMAFSVLGGIDGAAKGSGRRLRVGIPETHFEEVGMDRTVSRIFWKTVERLRGAEKFDMVDDDDVRFPDAEPITATRTTLQFREAAWFYDEIVRTEKLRKGMHADVLGFLDRGSRIGMLRYMRAHLARTEFIGEMNRIFRRFDLLLMPTCLSVAPKLEEVAGNEAGRIRQLLLRDTEPFNLCGLPALTVPATPPGEGLPVGIQLAGRYGEDMEVLRAGETVANALG
jgi:aspartyl-tRNA(Asn)/glutamyl-tRNA(Gln) amidotransferase subunit A